MSQPSFYGILNKKLEETGIDRKSVGIVLAHSGNKRSKYDCLASTSVSFTQSESPFPFSALYQRNLYLALESETQDIESSLETREGTGYIKFNPSLLDGERFSFVDASLEIPSIHPISCKSGGIFYYRSGSGHGFLKGSLYWLEKNLENLMAWSIIQGIL